MSDLQVRWLDYLAILIYLGEMTGMAVYFARRNTNTEEYFVGNRGFSGWVIGLSMLGTIISSATFLSLPAAAFALDWRQLAVNFALPFVAVLAVLVFIPLFRQGRMTTAFEYLGMRYGMVPRLYGTFSFIVMQLIRAAQVLFLLTLPIQFLTGAPLSIVIVGAGIFVAFYTVIGGIDTVIWTDVVQTIVLLAGGIICATAIILKMPGGIGQVLEIGTANAKFSFGSFDWDLSQRTFWTVALQGVVNWLAIYGGDQNIVQRYVSARTTREARKATIIYSSIALPMWAFFFFVGTSVFAYYQTFPDPTVATLQADQVLPFFILNHIPAGFAGLIVAAIIAAAMSTLDSSLNAIATVTRPYQIPYRIMLPERVRGLIVPVAASTTHVAYSSIRMEPTWMALGQAAGVAASLSVKLGCDCDEVPITQLQAILSQQGQVLKPRLKTAATHDATIEEDQV